MINVPVRVKDALRSGEYRKNVKITVPNVVMGYDIVRTKEPISTQQTYTEVWESMQVVGWEVDVSAYFFVTQKTDKLRIVADHTFTYWALMYENTLISEGAPDEVGGSIATTDCPDVPSTVPASAYQLILYIKTNSAEDKPSLLPVKFEFLKENHVIDNNNLVAESVKFDERMCSDTELKFGLCEGTSVEFQYFDFPNIRGQRINIEIEIQYKDIDNTLKWHTIPMGFFDVDECSRQASTGIMKATAYNKLKSGYLDVDVTARITEIIGTSPYAHKGVAEILDTLLSDYSFNTSEYEIVPGRIYSSGIQYTCGNGARIYTVDGFPYDPQQTAHPGYPVGKYFGIFSAYLYYIPVDESSTSTNHYYHYAVNFPAIWAVIEPGLRTLTQDLQPMGISGDLDVFTNNSYCVEDGEYIYVTPDGASDCAGYLAVQGGQIQIGEHKDSVYVTDDFTTSFPRLVVTVLVTCDLQDFYDTQPSTQRITDRITQKGTEILNALSNVEIATIYHKKMTPIEEMQLYVSDLGTNGITLRDLQSAVFEVDCQYGKLDRVSDLFAGIELNNGHLYPHDELYPETGLYPMGNSEAGYPSMYSKLWADEGNVRSFRYLYITYKSTENGQEIEKILQKTINANGTDDYIMDDNWLFRNLTWADADVLTYANAMASKMQGMRWFPFEMWCVGLPFLEAGDAIEINMKEGAYPTYILRRTLSGIQNLQDEMINGTLDIF